MILHGPRTLAIRMFGSLTIAAALVCAGCELPPLAPTPPDADRPLPTMTVHPGTVEIVRNATTGRITYRYQACTTLSNPMRGTRINMESASFTPVGSDGTAYTPMGTVGGYWVDPGEESSRCWQYSQFNAVHDTPTTYRFRFTYYLSDSSVLLPLVGTSTLIPRTR